MGILEVVVMLFLVLLFLLAFVGLLRLLVRAVSGD
jgi:hypothetical protein